MVQIFCLTTNANYSCTLPNAQVASKCIKVLLQLGAMEQTKKPALFGSTSADLFEIENESNMSHDDRLLLLPVHEWTVQDVQHWLTFLTYTDGGSLAEHLHELVASKQVDGSLLLSLQNNIDAIKALGVNKIALQICLKQYIQEASEKGLFFPWLLKLV